MSIRLSEHPVLVHESIGNLAVSSQVTLDEHTSVCLTEVGRSAVHQRLHALTNVEKDLSVDKRRWAEREANHKLVHSLLKLRIFGEANTHLHELVKRESEAALVETEVNSRDLHSHKDHNSTPIYVDCRYLVEAPITSENVAEKALVWADSARFEETSRPEVYGKIIKGFAEAITGDERLDTLSRRVQPEVWSESLYRVVSSLLPDTIRKIEDELHGDPCDAMLTVRLFNRESDDTSGREWYQAVQARTFTSGGGELSECSNTEVVPDVWRSLGSAWSDGTAVSGARGQLASSSDVEQATDFAVVIKFRANPTRPFADRMLEAEKWFETTSIVVAIGETRNIGGMDDGAGALPSS